MRVGIIGVGFVGSAIKESLEKHLFILNKTLFIYDKYKNDDTYVKNIEEILDTNILFICLPTPYHEDNEEYDIKSIDLTLDILNLSYPSDISISAIPESFTSSIIDFIFCTAPVYKKV
jgi:hypothetical protein